MQIPKHKTPIRGQRFGNWTVIGEPEIRIVNNKRAWVWRCICKCGTERKFTRSFIGSQQSKSCGCSVVKHGLMGHRNRHFLFRTWSGMKARCFNPKSTHYERYGGRGISVCERWLKLENFVSDMADSWKPNLTLGRIDNNGNYCPENCQWETRRQQSNNTKSNRFLEWRGTVMTVTEWARHFGIASETMFYRLRMKLPMERVMAPRKKHDAIKVI